MRAGQRESSSSFLKVFILQSTEREKKIFIIIIFWVRETLVFLVHQAPETVLSVKCVHRMTDIINLAKRKRCFHTFPI